MNKHQEQRNARVYEQQEKIRRETSDRVSSLCGDQPITLAHGLAMESHVISVRDAETLEWININLSDLNETMAKIERHLDFIAGALTSGDRS